MSNKIPKIIHYCWFGESKIPHKIIKRIENWKNILADYQFILWTENNFDLSGIVDCQFVQDAYNAKKWAYVADYVRIYVLKKYGGIYLDTDVVLLKKFDQFLDSDGFISFESTRTLCTAVIGAKKDANFLDVLLSEYSIMKFNANKLVPNSEIWFNLFVCNNNIDIHKDNVMIGDLNIYPIEFFCGKDYRTYEPYVDKNTVSIHELDATWYSLPRKIKRFIKKIILKIFGAKIYSGIKK